MAAVSVAMYASGALMLSAILCSVVGILQKKRRRMAAVVGGVLAFAPLAVSSFYPLIAY